MEKLLLFIAFLILPFNVSLLLACSYLYYQFKVKEARSGYNPFAQDERKERRPYITDQKQRDVILKQSFSREKIPLDLDAIVIGSGIGGLATAAILSKAGKKVLVLEQHDQAGGCCHTYLDKGYEFDVGIHYIGKMDSRDSDKFFLDQISEGQIEWKKLDEPYDYVTIGYGDEFRRYPIHSDLELWRQKLLEQLPEEKEGIEGFIDHIKSYKGFGTTAGILKLLSLNLAWLIAKTGLVHMFSNFWMGPYRKTTHQVVAGLTSNKDLQTVLTYSWGDYGSSPSHSQFATHMGLMKYFSRSGAYYPVGGASEIALNVIPVIERNGGCVLTRVNVTDIVIDGGRAIGVQVSKGNDKMTIRAPVVVSSAGLYNTFQRMLPPEISKKSYYTKIAENMKPGLAGFSVFIGFNASNEELGLKTTNTWAFTSNEMDAVDCYCALDVDEAMVSDVPVLFYAFPSAKDPRWDIHLGREAKSTCTIVTLVNWKWFQDFKDTKLKKRGDNYDEIKSAIGHRMVDQLCKLQPNVKHHIDYIEFGSPVTNLHYLNQPHGEIYGLDHAKGRFDPWMTAQLRPETDIPGLFLTGQDILQGGFAGGLHSGLFTASAILNRNLGGDLETLDEVLKQKS